MKSQRGISSTVLTTVQELCKQAMLALLILVKSVGSGEPQKVGIQETLVETHLHNISYKVIVSVVIQSHGITIQQDNIQNPQDENVLDEPLIVQEEISEPQVTLRWS